jgi:hypothetical protein
LSNGRIHAGENGDASGDFRYGDREFRVQAMAGFGTFASGVGFGHFHAARQIQVNEMHL